MAGRSIRRSFARSDSGVHQYRGFVARDRHRSELRHFQFRGRSAVTATAGGAPGDAYVGSNSSVEAFGISSLVSSYRDYVDIRDRAKSLDGLVAFRYATAGVATDPDATPRLSMGVTASSNLFAVMGVEPTISRAFRPEEDQVPGRDAVVVLGRTMWEQEFGSDSGVLARSLRINGQPFTVIGVAPPGFTGLDQFVRSDLLVRMMMAPQMISDPQAASLESARRPEPHAQGTT